MLTNPAWVQDNQDWPITKESAIVIEPDDLEPVRFSDLEKQIISYKPDGSIYVGGQFTNVECGSNTDYITQWNGRAWEAIGVRSDLCYVPTCHYCGLDTGSSYTCQHCQAPTSRWWPRLDEMLHNWRRCGA